MGRIHTQEREGEGESEGESERERYDQRRSQTEGKMVRPSIHRLRVLSPTAVSSECGEESESEGERGRERQRVSWPP